QALFMDSVPLPVAASESVLLVKEREPWAAGYVNGVLRAFSRGWQEVAFPDPGENPAAYLAAAASHPQWLVARWLSRWGFERTEQICRSNNRAAPVRSEEHTSELQSRENLVCRLLLGKKNGGYNSWEVSR